MGDSQDVGALWCLGLFCHCGQPREAHTVPLESLFPQELGGLVTGPLIDEPDSVTAQACWREGDRRRPSRTVQCDFCRNPSWGRQVCPLTQCDPLNHVCGVHALPILTCILRILPLLENPALLFPCAGSATCAGSQSIGAGSDGGGGPSSCEWVVAQYPNIGRGGRCRQTRASPSAAHLPHRLWFVWLTQQFRVF
jgi:hypothetical protein